MSESQQMKGNNFETMRTTETRITSEWSPPPSEQRESTFSADRLGSSRSSSDIVTRNNPDINKIYRTELVIHPSPTTSVIDQSVCRCCKCKGVINVKKQSEIKFNNRFYHDDCFNCILCRKSLNNTQTKQFKLDDNGEPICSQCELSNAKSCFVCRQFILEGRIITFDKKDYHKKCFSCGQCHKLLADQTNIQTQNSNPCCIECYDKYFAPQCIKCLKSISIGRIITYDGNKYHPDCFSCERCHKAILDRQFPTHNSKPYCSQCYDTHIAPQCFQCSKPISVGKSLIFDEKSYHPACFRCNQCNKSLADESDFAEHNSNPCCIECYNKYFALQCSKCSKAINGKYKTFEGKHYHPDCFICTKCRHIIDSTEKFSNDKFGFLCSTCDQ